MRCSFRYTKKTMPLPIATSFLYKTIYKVLKMYASFQSNTVHTSNIILRRIFIVYIIINDLCCVLVDKSKQFF